MRFDSHRYHIHFGRNNNEIRTPDEKKWETIQRRNAIQTLCRSIYQ